MAVSVPSVRSGIATRLDTITGLKVYTQPPDSINELPCAFVVPGKLDYKTTMGDVGFMGPFEITVLHAMASDIDDAQSALDPYMSPVGTYSVKAAINADNTLGGKADCSWLDMCEEYGILMYAEHPYLGCKFTLHVVAISA
ncbi:MAG: hypothetical protein SVY53_12155 [Chloroflexota bacterium]|nr:hypothetical protein [Chloroflexota bacterium]